MAWKKATRTRNILFIWYRFQLSILNSLFLQADEGPGDEGQLEQELKMSFHWRDMMQTWWDYLSTSIYGLTNLVAEH